MIPLQLALFNTFGNLALICAAGGLSGGIACLALRLRWSIKVLLLDVAIAGAATTLAFLPVVLIAYLRHRVDVNTGLLALAGIIAPVIRHAVAFSWSHLRGRAFFRKLRWR